MPYLLVLKKEQNLKLLSAANFRWPFMGSSPTCWTTSLIVLSTRNVLEISKGSLLVIDLTVCLSTSREIGETLALFISKALFFTFFKVNIFRMRLYLTIVAPFFVIIQYIKASINVRNCNTKITLCTSHLYPLLPHLRGRAGKITFPFSEPWYKPCPVGTS